MSAEPLTDPELDGLRWAHGPEGACACLGWPCVTSRLLATLDAARAAHTPTAGEGLDVSMAAQISAIAEVWRQGHGLWLSSEWNEFTQLVDALDWTALAAALRDSDGQPNG